jgi:Zn-dependent protease
VSIPLTIFVIVLFVFSVILHEIAHGVVAYRFGDDTAYLKNRITLNPLPHIDPVMTVIVPLFLYFSTSGAVVFGAAKGVPVNPLRLRHPRKDMAWVSAAGPLTNISLALLLAGAIRIQVAAAGTGEPGEFGHMILAGLAYVTLMNLLLACFNLIPIPPLDGSRILMRFLPWSMASQFQKLERFGFILIFLAIAFGVVGIVAVPALVAWFALMPPEAVDAFEHATGIGLG